MHKTSTERSGILSRFHLKDGLPLSPSDVNLKYFTLLLKIITTLRVNDESIRGAKD